MLPSSSCWLRPSGPIVGLGGGLAVHALGQFGQMLAVMTEVDDLAGIVEVFIGNVPDLRCSITNDNDRPSAFQAVAHRFSINAGPNCSAVSIAPTYVVEYSSRG